MAEALSLRHQDIDLDSAYIPGRCLVVLGHGAGAPMTHAHMTALAEALAEVDIGTLRFNFPFMQQGRRRVDTKAVCLEVFDAAINLAASFSDRLFIGGHSFGGRMATHLLAEQQTPVQGGILYSFPLHASKKPDTRRADHLPGIRQPLLFISGDRDTLAERELLRQVTSPLKQASVHFLETADHSFKILKRTRQSSENVYAEAARITASWIESLQ